MKIEKLWFQHDFTSRNDSKVIKLFRKYGAAGYGLFFMLLEIMAENNGTLEADYDLLAFNLRLSPDEAEILQSVIEDFGLFIFSDDKQTFSSKRLTENLNEMQEKREKARKAVEIRWANKKESIQKQVNNKSNAIALPKNNTTELQTYNESNADKIRKDKIRKDKIRKDKIREDNNVFDVAAIIPDCKKSEEEKTEKNQNQLTSVEANSSLLKNPQVLEAWERWKAYEKEKHDRTLTESEKYTLLGFLNAWGAEASIEAINDSIAKKRWSLKPAEKTQTLKSKATTSGVIDDVLGHFLGRKELANV